jgi:hypothetical protein
MAKKKERIVEQVFRSEFRREEGGAAIIRGLGYLKNSDFHSIVFCESKELKRRERRILLLPRHIKSMFDGAAAEHEMLASKLKKLRQENEQLMKSAIEHEALMLDLQSQIAENSRLQEENSQQQKNIEHLKKNIEDESLQEHNRPRKSNTNSAKFDEAGHLLRGVVALQGGLPCTKK